MPANGPMKRSGFNQAIYEQSVTKKEEIGTLRITSNGKKYRYARAGATALGMGKMGQAAGIAANVAVQAPTIADPVGARSINFTAGGAVTFVEDYFAGGYYQISTGTGIGHSYPIKASSAVTGGTEIIVTIEHGLVIANVVADSKITLVHSPWMGVIEAAVEENLAVGVPMLAVDIGYYYWAQTGGPGMVLFATTSAIGTGLMLDGTLKGEMDSIDSALVVDQPAWALTWGNVGVDSEYKACLLMIDR